MSEMVQIHNPPIQFEQIEFLHRATNTVELYRLEVDGTFTYNWPEIERLGQSGLMKVKDPELKSQIDSSEVLCMALLDLRK